MYGTSCYVMRSCNVLSESIHKIYIWKLNTEQVWIVVKMERLPADLCLKIFCWLDHQNLATAQQGLEKLSLFIFYLISWYWTIKFSSGLDGFSVLDSKGLFLMIPALNLIAFSVFWLVSDMSCFFLWMNKSACSFSWIFVGLC